MIKYKYNYIYIVYFILIVFLLFLSSKISHFKEYKSYNLDLIKTTYLALPGWHNKLDINVKNSFINSCNIIKNDKFKILKTPISFSFKNYIAFCEKLKFINNKIQLKEIIENYFDPYFFNNQEAKFTGYIELTVKGRKIKNNNVAPNSVPILKRPKNLLTIDLSLFNKNFGEHKLKGLIKDNKVVPFPSRKEIENYNLFEDNVLAYIDDPAQAFFLHIQGSGKIVLPNGEVMYVGYADNNGKNYTSIGKILLENNEILQEDISMQVIKAWMQKNPKKANEIRHLNERYIFFEERINKNVFGSSRAILEPMHSLAVDNTFIPFHIPIWAEIDSYNKKHSKYTGLFLAHDTGAAIKGPLRFDLFLGHGKEKEEIAGALNSLGKAWFLIPKEVER